MIGVKFLAVDVSLVYWGQNDMHNKLTRRKYFTAHMLVLPCTIVILLMMVYPLIQVFQFSFSEVKLPYFDTAFVGLENFKDVAQTPEFGRIWINTLIWTFVSIAIRFILGFAAALVMERGMKLLSVFRVLLLLPWVVPAIVAAHTCRWIYNADTGW